MEKNTAEERKMKRVQGNTLAEGETTGHAHRVQVQVLEREDGVRIFDGETDVTHEEHKVITLPDKTWASDKVKELDHVSHMERKVID